MATANGGSIKVEGQSLEEYLKKQPPDEEIETSRSYEVGKMSHASKTHVTTVSNRNVSGASHGTVTIVSEEVRMQANHILRTEGEAAAQKYLDEHSRDVNPIDLALRAAIDREKSCRLESAKLLEEADRQLQIIEQLQNTKDLMAGKPLKGLRPVSTHGERKPRGYWHSFVIDEILTSPKVLTKKDLLNMMCNAGCTKANSYSVINMMLDSEKIRFDEEGFAYIPQGE